MNHETLTETLAAIKAANEAELRRLAAGSGVPFTTLRKVRYGETLNPGVLTVQAVADFLYRSQAE